MRNKKSFFTLGIVALVLFLGVGYAVVSSVYLNIGGIANAANSELNVEITNAVAVTNIANKNVNFSHELSDNNLSSDFTLTNLEKGEIVDITYTITNNEKDVDAELSLSRGVIVNNFNPDFFDVNYEITDDKTDLENNDNTMEVIVSVEVIKTPVTEEESSTRVILYFTASPKGTNEFDDYPPVVTTDVLDNLWPVAWKVLDVKDNFGIEDGFLARVSNLTPSVAELQEMNLVATTGEDTMTLIYDEGIEEKPISMALYSDGKNEFVVYSVGISMDFGDGTIIEPGLYVWNIGKLAEEESEDEIDLSSFSFRFERKTSPRLRFGQKYYLTTFLKQDMRTVEDWIMFNEDGTITQGEFGITFPEDGYTYSKDKIYFVMDGTDYYMDVSANGKYLTYGEKNSTLGVMLTVETVYNELKDVPFKFGLKYICTTDNVSAGEKIGSYFYGYVDGSGVMGDLDGEVEQLPYGYWYYTPTEIQYNYSSDGTSILVSEDGNTITFMKDGSVIYIYTSGFENNLPIDYQPEEIVGNATVTLNSEVISDTNIVFTKFTSEVINYAFMINSEAQIEGSDFKSFPLVSVVSRDDDAYILKYANESCEFYVIVIPEPGEYFGTTFTESGMYGSNTNGDTHIQIELVY